VGLLDRLLGRYFKVEGVRWHDKAMAELEAGDLAGAHESAWKALELYELAEYRLGIARSHNVLGHVLQGRGQLQEALDHQQQSLCIAQELREVYDEEIALGGLGTAYADLGRYEEAAACLQAQIESAGKRDDPESLWSGHGNLAHVLRRQGRIRDAAEHAQESIRWARLQERTDREVQGLLGLAADYRLQGDYGRSLAILEEALALSRQLPNSLIAIGALSQLGIQYLEIGDFAKALQVMQEGLEIARSRGAGSAELVLLADLAGVHIARRENESAYVLFQEALRKAQEIQATPVEAKLLSNLGSLVAAGPDPLAAFYFYERSLWLKRQIGDRRGIAATLSNLGIAWHWLGDQEQAAAFHEQAVALAQEISDPFVEGTALNNLGIVLIVRRRFTEAEAVLERATALWDSLRDSLEWRDMDKVALLQEQGLTYMLLQKALVEQGRKEDALVASERGRARALADRIASRLTSRLAEALAGEPKIEVIRRIAREQAATLVQYSVLFEEVMRDGRRGLQGTEILAWVVQLDGQVRMELIPILQEDVAEPPKSPVPMSLEPLRYEIRDLAMPKVVASPEEEAKAGYDFLIRPIEKWLPDDPEARIIFIPQGALSLVPFPTLQRDLRGPRLLDCYVLSIAPSIQVLGLAHRQAQALRQEVRGGLVVGNPEMPILPSGRPLPALPGAENEAKAIAGQLGTVALLGDRATKAAVLQGMPGKKVVHLATHGIFEVLGDAEIPGALALAPADEDSGILTAREILELDLRAELVVLSACSTGRGNVRSEGVIGLAYAFLSAGVPSLLVSLWPVPDLTTAELMKGFHTALARGVDKAQALRQAMLETSQRHTEAVHWAGFVLLGEPR